MIVTRRVEFDAAHRIINHESKCKFLHGHRYVLEVSFSAPELDSLGRVVDFGFVKDKIKTWIDNNFDHTTILSIKDEKLGTDISTHTNQKIYYMKENPTAENIAIHLKEIILPTLFKNSNFSIERVKLYETPNCSVEI
jgi:6-pyruvoyltetrahydropterin/6-carboxytetrahydropterin synthase